MVTQGKYNLGRYKYRGKVTLGRVDRDKFNQGIVNQGKDKVTQGKYNLGRYKHPGKLTLGRFTKGKINRGI